MSHDLVQIECWGHSPHEIKLMALNEAAKYFGTNDVAIHTPVLAHPRYRNHAGEVLEWEADVVVEKI